jgi:carboxypeptidase Q
MKTGACALTLLSELLIAAAPALAETSQSDRPEVDAAVLSRIESTAVSSNWAWDELETLTDAIGPRLSGSPQLSAAIDQLARELRALGAQVTLQPSKVDHWVRGESQAELVSYPGQPSGVMQRLQLTSLGRSSATPAAGIEANVIVIRDFDDLHARAKEVRGAIVLFDSRFDEALAENGHAGPAYGRAVKYRAKGPSEAASLGAAAALVRSIGGADYRLPHTGLTQWNDHQEPIPAAALSSEDADLVMRLSARGPVRMRLLLAAQTLPDADSFNVLADWPGYESPHEYVVVSGHLDSWDLGTGAIDDGVGVVAAAGVIQTLQQLKLHARRTIRFIAWTDEEFGGRGADTYSNSLGSTVSGHCAAIESDAGAGRPLGLLAALPKESLAALKPVTDALAPLGATLLLHQDRAVGTDIAPLQAAGVPGFAPLVDTRRYFDYHHTAADTLDKVDRRYFQSQVAAMSVLAYFLADRPDCLTRYPIKSER